MSDRIEAHEKFVEHLREQQARLREELAKVSNLLAQLGAEDEISTDDARDPHEPARLAAWAQWSHERLSLPQRALVRQAVTQPGSTVSGRLVTVARNLARKNRSLVLGERDGKTTIYPTPATFALARVMGVA